VGDKVLEIVMRDNLVENSRQMGKILHEGLHNLQAKFGCIGEIRGRGLMAGVEIVSDRKTKAIDVDLSKAISERAFELGVWANISADFFNGGAMRM